MCSIAIRVAHKQACCVYFRLKQQFKNGNLVKVILSYFCAFIKFNKKMYLQGENNFKIKMNILEKTNFLTESRNWGYLKFTLTIKYCVFCNQRENFFSQK